MRRTLIAFVVAMLLAPATNLCETTLVLGGGTAEAAPRKAGIGKKRNAKPVRKGKPRKTKRSRASGRGPAVPMVDVTDDPSKTLDEAWKANVQRWFAANRPEYGSFVALDPDTGRVLVMAERSANPGRIPHPALAAAFPAASIFKIVTAAALLTNGVRSEASACYSGGLHGLSEQHIRDNPRRDRACRSLAVAFAHSTNAVFGKLALKHLDAARLFEQSQRLGFNRSVSVDGLDVRSKTTRAAPGLDLARMAAGFVNSNLVPLHAAVIAATIANGGRLPTGVTLGAAGADAPAVAGGTQVIDPAVAQALRDMMSRTSVEGTGRKHLAGFATLTSAGGVAVKTGTLTSRDGSGVFNTWMVGFYPARKPEFAFAAHIGSAGPGPIKAGHLTRFAINTWWKLKKARAGRS